MAAYQGRCLCGEVSYDVLDKPQMAGICHCKNCQRQAGQRFQRYGASLEPIFN